MSSKGLSLQSHKSGFHRLQTQPLPRLSLSLLGDPEASLLQLITVDQAFPLLYTCQ